MSATPQDRESLIVWMWHRRRAIGIRLLIGFLLLTWIHLFPMYILLVYFAKKGFLSFDLLAGGMLGMHWVFAWSGGFLLLLSIYLWSPLCLLAYHFVVVKAKRVNGEPSAVKRVHWFLWIVSVLLSAVMFYGIYYASGKGQTPWPRVLGVVLITLVVAAGLTFFIQKTLKEAVINWGAPLFILMTSTLMPALMHDATADLVEAALRQFRIGGGLPVRVFSISATSSVEQVVIEGRLLLTSVNNVFIEKGEVPRTTLVTLTNTQNLRLEVEQPSAPKSFSSAVPP